MLTTKELEDLNDVLQSILEIKCQNNTKPEPVITTPITKDYDNINNAYSYYLKENFVSRTPMNMS